jgi:[phosphatase 2A protein]-leucine-carboxy methyltransferase
MAPPSGPSIPPKPYSIGKGGTSLLSPIYSLIPLDLRASPAAQLEDEVLPLLDPQLPTLFLAECVFCYMSPKLSEEVVQWFGKTFNRVVGVVYEMCGLK